MNRMKMDKHIWHGVIMSMVLAICFAATGVHSEQFQMTPESIQKTMASEKFALKFPVINKGRVKEWKHGFDIGSQIWQCFGNYDELKGCVDEIQEVFTSGDLHGLSAGCCEAFNGITEDCLAMKVVGYLPQVRVPMTGVSAYCTFVNTVHGLING